MNKIALFLLAMLIPASVMAQPTHEWKIARPTYTVLGTGVAYNDGTWKESDATIDYSNPTKWENLELPTPWSVNTSNLTLTMSRGSQASTIRPDGIYWLNTTTWAVTEAVGWAVPVVTENPTSVFLDGMLNAGDGDAELISSKSGITWDYVFNDTTGWTANPYDPAESALIVRYQLGRNHTVTADGVAVDWGGTVASRVTFEAAGEEFDLASVQATDATGAETPITYYLRTAQGKDWFMEGVSAEDFAVATLPIRYHYETRAGVITESITLETGNTYFIDNLSTVPSTYTLTVQPGAILKFADDTTNGVINCLGTQACDFNGTTANPIILTSCNDDTRGDIISASETNCSKDPVAVCDYVGMKRIEGDHYGAFVGIKVHYGGGAQEGVFEFEDSYATDIQDVIFDDVCPTYPVIYNYNASGAKIDDIYNVFINAGSANWTPTGIVDIDQRDSFPNILDGVLMKNMLVVYAGTDDVALFSIDGNNSTNYANYRADNLTAVCTNDSATATGFLTDGLSRHASGGLYNSVASGCANGFKVTPFVPEGNHDYNLSFDNTDDYAGDFNKAANELESPNTAAYEASGHTPDTFGPTWLTNYHQGSASNGIDAGSDTSANLGLDAYHTQTANLDTGVVDLGFHMLDVVTEAGGGPAPGPSGISDPTTPPGSGIGPKIIWRF